MYVINRESVENVERNLTCATYQFISTCKYLVESSEKCVKLQNGAAATAPLRIIGRVRSVFKAENEERVRLVFPPVVDLRHWNNPHHMFLPNKWRNK